MARRLWGGLIMAKEAATNGRGITTREATVKTFGVTIKALPVGKKQVTMGLLRQLQGEDLIDPETGQLNGVPWGKVNYFWGDCKPDHIHVVWQKGDELWRACAIGTTAWQVRGTPRQVRRRVSLFADDL